MTDPEVSDCVEDCIVNRGCRPDWARLANRLVAAGVERAWHNLRFEIDLAELVDRSDLVIQEACRQRVASIVKERLFTHHLGRSQSDATTQLILHDLVIHAHPGIIHRCVLD